MLWESHHVSPPQPTRVVMMTSWISLDGFYHRIKLFPECGKYTLRYFSMVHRSITNILCQLRMSDYVHLLWASACLPKFILCKSLDFAGLKLLQTL